MKLLIVACFILLCVAVGVFLTNKSDLPRRYDTVAETVQTVVSPKPDPLSIEYLRQKEYPGSELQIVEELTPGSNYNRFIASYDSEGNTIYGLLTIPNTDIPSDGWPVIIISHGDIPPDQYINTQKYVAHIRSLSTAGYIVFMPDYRGHGESEGKATNGYSTPDYTVDVLNAIASLRKHPNVNPEKIGLLGHSTGGHISLRIMVVDPNIKAVVIWGGVVGSYQEMLEIWPTYWETVHKPSPIPDPDNPHTNWRTYLSETYGSPNENPEKWKEITATTYISDISAALQMHHARDDGWVPVKLSELLHEKMLNKGKHSELYLYESSDHNLFTDYTAAMNRTTEFLDKYLKNP